MRLLHAETYKLVEFVGEFGLDIPLYAIVSHTWESEEVLFSHMADLDVARQMKGFSKVANACRQTRIDGLQWIWIDTCCIDKSSSAELSEAINSMYQWYQKAVVCYAFLSDVESIDEFHGSFAAVESGSTSIGAWIRWFSRGWTLQELISPNWIKFYDCHWRYLGTKKELEPRLAAATGIDAGILNHSVLLSSVPAARKMHWASQRKTKRVEDLAYCLLGLFDINMPLLYGEGSGAFHRLQEHILRTTEDHTLFIFGPNSLSLSNMHRRRAYVKPALASNPAEFKAAHDLIPFQSHQFGNPRLVKHHSADGPALRIQLPLIISLGFDLPLPPHITEIRKPDSNKKYALVAYNIRASPEAMQILPAYDVTRSKLITPADSNILWRIVEVSLCTSEAHWPGIKSIMMTGYLLLVSEKDIATWSTLECCFWRPQATPLRRHWNIVWSHPKSTDIGLGYSLTWSHESRNVVRISEMGGFCRVIWVRSILSSKGRHHVIIDSFEIADYERQFCRIYTIADSTPNSVDINTVKAEMGKPHWEIPEEDKFTHLEMVDGLLYERRHRVDESLEISIAVVRKGDVAHGLIGIDTHSEPLSQYKNQNGGGLSIN